MEAENAPIRHGRTRGQSGWRTLLKVLLWVLLGGVGLMVIGFVFCLIVIAVLS